MRSRIRPQGYGRRNTASRVQKLDGCNSVAALAVLGIGTEKKSLTPSGIGRHRQFVRRVQRDNLLPHFPSSAEVVKL
jgi:hypothetical protein